MRLLLRTGIVALCIFVGASALGGGPAGTSGGAVHAPVSRP